ncbi:arylamine N-acetyltransferase [Streptomyces sp. NPDC005438]|uniref:arylamine N-acetyltransferase family protein n=1 Tax=Streptomyces sp. NPDC005438 TaxID=3156880 RepID=UPI0033AD0A3F
MTSFALAPERRDAYLRRIGMERPREADAAALRALHRGHLRAVPFENLGIHLGEGLSLDPEALAAKVIDRRRGGLCYELNGMFAALLTALGYEVALLNARPFAGDQPGPAFDHLALRVNTPEPWLVDVGFGRHAEFPLRLEERGEQPDPGGVFRLEEVGDGDLDLSRDGEPQYRLEPRPRQWQDFTMGCWWHGTSPDSHFARSLVCSRLTDSGRITLSDRLLTVTEGGERREERLTEAEALAAYPEHFGFTLDRLPPAPPGPSAGS